jgi:phage FluMu protein Com
MKKKKDIGVEMAELMKPIDVKESLLRKGRIGTTTDVSRAFNDIKNATLTLNSAYNNLQQAQKNCNHVWVFVGQINAYHERNYQVSHRCAVCTLIRMEVRTPICPSCPEDVTLNPATDKEALEQVKKMGYPPFSGEYKPYRCPKCKELHILQTRGD